MSVQPGAKQLRGYGVETTFGTAVTPDRWFGIVQDSPDNSERTVQEFSAAGNMETSVIVPVEYSFKGSIDTMPQDFSIFRTVYNVRTVSAPAGGGSSVTTFDWNDASGVQPSFTYENHNAGSPAITRRFTSAKWNSFKATHDNRNILHFQGDWIAKTVIASGTATGTYTVATTQPYLFNHGEFAISGVALATVKTVTLNWNIPQEEDYYIKSGAEPTVTELNETTRRYDAEVQVGFTNIDQYQRFLGFVGAGSANTVGSEFNSHFLWAKSSTDKLLIVCSGCFLSAAPTDGGNEGTLSQTLRLTIKDVNPLVVTASGTTPV